MTDDISEYSASDHQLILSRDQVEVGDRIGNCFVGECWVTEKPTPSDPGRERPFLLVRYRGIHRFSGAEMDFYRSDPLGFREDISGHPDPKKPYFWKKR